MARIHVSERYLETIKGAQYFLIFCYSKNQGLCTQVPYASSNAEPVRYLKSKSVRKVDANSFLEPHHLICTPSSNSAAGKSVSLFTGVETIHLRVLNPTLGARLSAERPTPAPSALVRRDIGNLTASDLCKVQPSLQPPRCETVTFRQRH